LYHLLVLFHVEQLHDLVLLFTQWVNPGRRALWQHVARSEEVSYFCHEWARAVLAEQHFRYLSVGFPVKEHVEDTLPAMLHVASQDTPEWHVFACGLGHGLLLDPDVPECQFLRRKL
jgi:hypothetical protein